VPFPDQILKIIKMKAGYYYAFGYGAVIFGATYLFPPFYTTFCEKTGYRGSDF
jgi:cytochrome c oxidase assembly protein Cox11